MKVTHLIGCFDKSGGAEQQLYEIVLQQSLKYEVCVVDFWCDGSYIEKLQNIGISCKSIGAKNNRDLYGYIRLFRFLKKQKPDILNCWLPSANLYGTVIGRAAGIHSIITSIRNVDDWKPWYYSLLDRIVLRMSDAIVVNSNIAKSYSINSLGFDSSKFIKINNILPEKLLSYESNSHARVLRSELLPNVSKNDFVILVVNRLHEEKRTLSVLNIFHSLKSRKLPVKLVIIGQGEEYGKINKIRNNSEYSDDIYLLGWKDNVYDYMCISDVFVLLSVREGMSNSLMEAQYLGTPAIVTDAGGNSELVSDQLTGYLVPKYGYENMVVEHIQVLINDQYKFNSLKENSKKNILAKFSIKKTVSAYDELYSSLVK